MVLTRYDFCIREKVVDGNLIAKWKKPGYEFLCSLAAINKGSTNFGTTNICRVPLRLRSGKIAPAVLTGCISCASCDKVAGPLQICASTQILLQISFSS